MAADHNTGATSNIWSDVTSLSRFR